jgi:hypothetical protein
VERGGTVSDIDFTRALATLRPRLEAAGIEMSSVRFYYFPIAGALYAELPHNMRFLYTEDSELPSGGVWDVAERFKQL